MQKIYHNISSANNKETKVRKSSSSADRKFEVCRLTGVAHES